MVELLWDRKYDKSGAKSAPLQLALPFQTIETLNESSQQRQKSIDSFLTGRGKTEWRNRLIWGDKKYVLPSLLPEFANSVDLIYIDPPFDTGADFSYLVEVPDHQVDTTSFTKLPSMIEQKAYRDTWGTGSTHLDSYLRWFYETIIFLEKLLKPSGSIYMHLDWRICHHVKVLADEVFGQENFLNEIVWRRSFTHGDAKQGAKHFGRCTDSILFYVKSDSATWNPQYTQYSDEALNRDYKYTEKETDRVYRLAPVDGPGGPSKGNPFYEFLGVKGYWRFKKERMQRLYEENRIVRSSTGKSLSQKMYLDESKGRPVDNLWDDVSRVSPTSSERLGYPTQNRKLCSIGLSKHHQTQET